MASGGVARPMDEAAIDVEGLGDAVDRLALGQALADLGALALSAEA
jgi:hypothetical protein